MPFTRLFSPSLPELIDPISQVLPLPEKAVVKRLDAESLHLTWTNTAVTTHIFAGPYPTQIDYSKPVAVVHNGREAIIQEPDTAVRPYFALQFEGGDWHGRTIITAERFLPFPGAVNFRDVGGYETTDGRIVQWGLLYRSGVLAHLTAADWHSFGNPGVRLVCDLRTESETRKRPDQLPADNLPGNHLQYKHIPAQSMERSARWRGLTAVLFNRSRLDELMDEGYTRVMIDENPAVIGNVLRHLAQPTSYPAIIHCSAGKDRTAIIIALLLHVLGVPQETILADYTLSNLHYDKFRAGIDQDIASLRRLGITVDHMQSVILVRAERLQKMMRHIDFNYGSVEHYLFEKAGISDTIIRQLQSILLT